MILNDVIVLSQVVFFRERELKVGITRTVNTQHLYMKKSRLTRSTGYLLITYVNKTFPWHLTKYF